MVMHHAVSVATVTGLLVIVWHLWDSDDTTLACLRRLLVATAVFYAARSVHWLTQGDVFRTLTILVVAMLPLLILLVVEQFMRRHAPFYLKSIVVVGACLFVIGSFFSSINTTPMFVYTLLVFQLCALGPILWFIYRRDRSSLNTEENQTINRIALVLIIIVPLLVSDYGLTYLPLPTNWSGLGVVTGCWILIHMHDRMLSRTRIVLELSVLIVFALTASVFISWYTKLSIFQWIETLAMLIAFTMAAATLVGVFHLRWRNGPMGSVTRGLLHGESFHDYLANLKQRDPGCLILSADDLAEFDAAMLIGAFDINGAINRSELPAIAESDDMMQSQIRNLLHRFGANRAFLVAKEPLHIALAQRQGLTDAPDTELSAAFSLARLMAERDYLRKRALSE